MGPDDTGDDGERGDVEGESGERSLSLSRGAFSVEVNGAGAGSFR